VFRSTCSSSIVRWVWSRLWSFQVQNSRAAGVRVELYEKMDQGVPAKYPLYGRDAHRTRAGIHADGLNKFWWMYAPFDVPKLLGRPLELSFTKDSGIAGIIFLVKQHTGREPSKDDPKLRPRPRPIAAAVRRRQANGGGMGRGRRAPQRVVLRSSRPVPTEAFGVAPGYGTDKRVQITLDRSHQLYVAV
jgi:hypothetical protein